MYFEVQVIFTEEIQTKSGIREKQRRKHLLVECDSVTVAEATVNSYLKDAPYPFEVVVVKQSKISGVI